MENKEEDKIPEEHIAIIIFKNHSMPYVSNHVLKNDRDAIVEISHPMNIVQLIMDGKRYEVTADQLIKMIIDKPILNRQRIIKGINNAKIRGRWDYAGSKRYAHLLHKETGAQKSLDKTLVSRIDELSNELIKAHLKHPDCLIVSAEFNAKLCDNEFYYRYACTDELVDSKGIELVANLDHRYKIYRDLYLPASMAVLGNEEEIFGAFIEINCAAIYIDNLR